MSAFRKCTFLFYFLPDAASILYQMFSFLLIIIVYKFYSCCGFPMKTFPTHFSVEFRPIENVYNLLFFKKSIAETLIFRISLSLQNRQFLLVCSFALSWRLAAPASRSLRSPLHVSLHGCQKPSQSYLLQTYFHMRKFSL